MYHTFARLNWWWGHSLNDLWLINQVTFWLIDLLDTFIHKLRRHGWTKSLLFHLLLYYWLRTEAMTCDFEEGPEKFLVCNFAVSELLPEMELLLYVEWMNEWSCKGLHFTSASSNSCFNHRGVDMSPLSCEKTASLVASLNINGYCTSWEDDDNDDEMLANSERLFSLKLLSSEMNTLKSIKN